MAEKLDLQALKIRFDFHLKQLENLNPESFAAMTAFLLDLGEKIEVLISKPDRTLEEQQLIEVLIQEIQQFIGKLSEAQVLMRKRDWKDTQEIYERLQKEAAAGDVNAQKELNEFEPVYFSLRERMESDAEIDFPSTSSLKFLHSLNKL